MNGIGAYADNADLAKTCAVCKEPILVGQLFYGAGNGGAARHSPDCTPEPDSQPQREGLDR